MKQPEYIMIHHTAVSYTKNSDQFKAVNLFHQRKWGIKSSLGYYNGYHYEIASSGRVRQARKDGEEAVACYQKKMNDGRCLHICLDGNFDSEDPLPRQIYALRDLLKKLVKKYDITRDNILFHRQLAKKSCPRQHIDYTFISSLPY